MISAPRPATPTSVAEFITQYSVPEENTQAVNGLRGHDVVFICDNSGSMESPLIKGGSETRWEKLLRYASMICDLAPLIDKAFDLCWLNQLTTGKYLGEYFIRNIRSQEDVKECFKDQPYGITPLIKRINEVITQYRSTLEEKDLLLYIATDGINNENGQETPGAMKEWVKNTFAIDPVLRQHVKINFMLLSDEQKVIDEYDGVDRLKGPNGEHLFIDVTSPFHIEKEQFEKANRGKTYTEGMHIAKMLTGATNKNMDGADERKVEFTKKGNINTEATQPQGCCIIC